MRLRLVLKDNSGQGVLLEREFNDDIVTFGRHPKESSLPIPDRDKRVSVFHGRFERRPSGWVVRDLKSTNGTLLNGQALMPSLDQDINEGDVVTVGGFTITIHLIADATAFEQTLSHFDLKRATDAFAARLHQVYGRGDDLSAEGLRQALRAEVATMLNPLTPEQSRALLKAVMVRHRGGAAVAGDPDTGTSEEQLYMAGFMAFRGLARRFVGDDGFERPEDVGKFARLVEQALEVTFEWLSRCIQGREAFEEQFGAEVTMVFQRGGNPIKSAKEPEKIARHVLDWASDQGLASVRQQLESVYKDLTEHQLGLLAGVREAIRAVVERLDPDAIEAMLPKGGFSLGSRGAKAFEAYRALYKEVVEERSRLFHEVIAPNLRKGYLQSHDDCGPTKAVPPEAS